MRLALLADLHFGRARPELVEPLLASLGAAAPDLCVIAGDFVQRARPWQFRLAADFVERMGLPWLSVPGNHDIPLFDLPRRLLDPRRAYRRWIDEVTEPVHVGDSAVVAGVDTTHRYSHQRGRIRPDQIRRVAELVRAHHARRTAVIVAHHPFHQAKGIEKKLMLGAPRALEAWAEAGPHVILAGHLHQWAVEPFVVAKNAAMTLQVHCGTGLSTRLRGEPNEWALIDIDPPGITIRRMVAGGPGTAFQPSETISYVSGPSGWAPC